MARDLRIASDVQKSIIVEKICIRDDSHFKYEYIKSHPLFERNKNPETFVEMLIFPRKLAFLS